MEDSKDPDSLYEQELANLITDIGDRIAGGEEVKLEKIYQAHPEYADDIRELMGTLMVTQAAGSKSSEENFDEGKFASLELP